MRIGEQGSVFKMVNNYDPIRPTLGNWSMARAFEMPRKAIGRLSNAGKRQLTHPAGGELNYSAPHIPVAGGVELAARLQELHHTVGTLGLACCRLSFSETPPRATA